MIGRTTAAIAAASILAACAPVREVHYLPAPAAPPPAAAAPAPSYAPPPAARRPAPLPQRDERAMHLAAYCFGVLDQARRVSPPEHRRTIDGYARAAASFANANGFDVNRDELVVDELGRAAEELYRNDRDTFVDHLAVCFSLIDEARGTAAGGKRK